MECPDGDATSGLVNSGPDPATEGYHAIELARLRFSHEMQAGDVVELAGYPRSRGREDVRVVRDGRVIAAFGFRGGRRHPMEDSFSRCGGGSPQERLR